MKHYLGIDGGGTRTTIALADEAGVELCRRTGSAGIVDPRWPLAAAESVLRLVREVLAQAGVKPPVEALCAGLAGTGDPEGRDAVQRALEGARVARRVVVCSDGEIALEGALLGRPGVLLVAGTGSVAWGRGEDGRMERCGGWGMIAGDEGSAYWLGREALRAALRAYDGRGEKTSLLSRVLELAGAGLVEELPRWAGRAEKGEIAALAQEVVRAAEAGDAVAASLVNQAAAALAEHAVALIRRLSPWGGPVPVVLHGGLAGAERYAATVEGRLRGESLSHHLQGAAAEPAGGALRLARAEAAAS